MRDLILSCLILGCGMAAPASARTGAPPDTPAGGAPPLLDCNYPNPYVVFFELNRDGISQVTSRILDNLIAVYRLCGTGSLLVAGYADRSGEPPHNLALSRRRASAVARYLERHGIPTGVVTIQAFGESMRLIETQDGREEPQNRRVEIRFGPPTHE